MRSRKLQTLSLFLILLVLFSCTRKTGKDAIADNAEIKAFVKYFFVPGSTLRKEATGTFSLHDRDARDLPAPLDPCSPDVPCNRTKEYSLEFTPNFLFETVDGHTTLLGADPDAFVDLCDRRDRRVHRVRATGTDGSIYGTFWVSDLSFVVYGLESEEAFVEVYNIEEGTRTSYSIDKAKRRADADTDAFLIAKYGDRELFRSEHGTDE